MATSFKSSVNLKAVGTDPKKLAVNLQHDGDEALYATVYGRADKVGSRRENPRIPGEYFEGIVGLFEAVSPDATMDTVSSSTLYAPDAIHEQLKDALNAPGRVGSIEFAFESYVVKGGTAGFTWKHKFVSQGAAEADPLAALKASVAKQKTTALPAPEKGPVPEKGKKG